MKAEPVEAAEFPPAFGLFSDGETAGSNWSISELISDLRSAFRSSNFDRVEEILIAREEKLKRELEKKKLECELTRERLAIERLERAEAEAKCTEFQGRYEKLLREVKEAENQKRCDFVESKNKKEELESSEKRLG